MTLSGTLVCLSCKSKRAMECAVSLRCKLEIPTFGCMHVDRYHVPEEVQPARSGKPTDSLVALITRYVRHVTRKGKMWFVHVSKQVDWVDQALTPHDLQQLRDTTGEKSEQRWTNRP